MADFLGGIATSSRKRVEAARRHVPLAEIRARTADLPPAPVLRLSPDGFDVIAEIKRRAPGDGPTSPGADVRPGHLAVAYAAGGAAAVSVLTEPLAFAGSLDDLEAASRTLARGERPIPTMRKDFIVDPYQVFEARAAGAGGVLLIADLLAPRETDALLDAAAETGVWILVEVFADERVAHAVRIARQATRRDIRAFVGVNVRDLHTLEVDPDRLRRAADRLPSELPRVAESGMCSADDVARAARLGYGLALVGRALSGSADPRAFLEDMLRAGRAARREAACARRS